MTADVVNRHILNRMYTNVIRSNSSDKMLDAIKKMPPSLRGDGQKRNQMKSIT